MKQMINVPNGKKLIFKDNEWKLVDADKLKDIKSIDDLIKCLDNTQYDYLAFELKQKYYNLIYYCIDILIALDVAIGYYYDNFGYTQTEYYDVLICTIDELNCFTNFTLLGKFESNCKIFYIIASPERHRVSNFTSKLCLSSKDEQHIYKYFGEYIIKARLINQYPDIKWIHIL